MFPFHIHRSYYVTFFGLLYLVLIIIAVVRGRNTVVLEPLDKQQGHQIMGSAAKNPKLDKVENLKSIDNLPNPLINKLGLEKKQQKSKPKDKESVPYQLPFCNQQQGEQLRNFDGENLTSSEETDEEQHPLIPRNTLAQNEIHNERHFLVATLDGKVTLLNQAGHEIWSISTGELFSSTVSSLELRENGKWVNLIPSLSGGLYRYNSDGLLPMPMNADSLLKKSFKISNDVVITGGKELRTLGIDIRTGKLRYDCGISGCTTISELEGIVKDMEPVTLVVKKQLQTVRAIDSSTGNEKWNFSVGTHELALAGVTEGCFEGEQKEPGVLNFVKVIIPEGRILGVDPDVSSAVWDKKFESPIAQAWVMEKGRLISVDPVQNTLAMEQSPTLYVGVHNQQFYVQESQIMNQKLEIALENYSRSPEDPKKGLNIAWKPTISVIEGEETALTPIVSQKPPTRPFYVFDKDQLTSTEYGENLLAEPYTTPMPQFYENVQKGPDMDFAYTEGESDTIINQVIIGSLWYWWKEVLGISLLTAVVLNILMFKPLLRAVRLETFRNTIRFFQDQWNHRNEEGLAIMPAEPVARDHVEYQNDNSPNNDISRYRTVSNSSSQSPYVESPEQEVFFLSQYLREFDPIQCLGKGGFGVVFEAKKKIDDRNYAVKRITLPNRENARVRVMREVKALAQLDHKNVVRYFNAWIEHPPNGWLEKYDPLWNSCNVGSVSPTMEYPSDFMQYTSVSYSKLTSVSESVEFSKNKRNHSKIAFRRVSQEDSFIVFDANLPSNAVSKDNLLEEDQIETSCDDSSSVSGVGFWKRPTSLDIISVTDDKSFSQPLSKKEENPKVDEDGVEVGEEACEGESSSVMYLYIQQELCQKRTLQDWLRCKKDRSVPAVIRFFAQIVDAVEYVHSKKLIHRDLKPSNIFLAGDMDNELEMVIKIGDFGLATTALAEPDADEVFKGSPTTPVKNSKSKVNLTRQVGTHLYMSPEQFQRKPYDYKVDIYSLGLIFFELLVPFTTEMERHDVISRVRKFQLPSTFSELFPEEHKLIREMISHNPNHRPDATMINQWVKSHLRTVSPVESPTGGSPAQVFTTFRSQSSPAHMNITTTERKSLELGTAHERNRKLFKTQSTTSM